MLIYQTMLDKKITELNIVLITRKTIENIKKVGKNLLTLDIIQKKLG